MAMSSSSVTKKPIRASRWNYQETLDLIEVWRDPSIRSGLKSRKAATERKIARCMKKKGHNRNFQQCSTKMRDLKYTYFKAEKANAQPGALPQRCPFYDQLHAILGRNLTGYPRQTVGSTQETPSRCMENSLALGQGEQDVGNNQAANSSVQDSTDPREGPSAGHAGSFWCTRPSPAAVRRSQIHRQKWTREDILKEQMEKSNKFLERIAAQQAGIGKQLERVVEWQEGIGACLERIATQQKGIVERQERVVEQQERLAPVVTMLKRNLSCSSPGPVASTPQDPRTRGENSRVPSYVTSRDSQDKSLSSHF